MKMNHWSVEVMNKEVTFSHHSGTKVVPTTVSNEHIVMCAYLNHSGHTDILLVVKGSVDHRSVKLDIKVNRKVYLTIVVVGERMACTFDGQPSCYEEWYIQSCRTKKFMIYYNHDSSSSSDSDSDHHHGCNNCNYNHRHHHRRKKHHHHHHHHNREVKMCVGNWTVILDHSD